MGHVRGKRLCATKVTDPYGKVGAPIQAATVVREANRMATCPKCQSWNDNNYPSCVSCGQAISKDIIWSKMGNWVLGVSCVIGLHRGEWAYDYRLSDSGPKHCAQTRFCSVCRVESSRIQHDITWESDGIFWESGVCGHCKQSYTREKRDRITGGGRW